MHRPPDLRCLSQSRADSVSTTQHRNPSGHDPQSSCSAQVLPWDSTWKSTSLMASELVTPTGAPGKCAAGGRICDRVPLRLPAGYLKPHSVGPDGCRVIHYPPLHSMDALPEVPSPSEQQPGQSLSAPDEIDRSTQLSCGEHTDYGVALLSPSVRAATLAQLPCSEVSSHQCGCMAVQVCSRW